MTESEEYLTSGEVQKLLKISRNSLLKLRKLGLPYIRLDRKILYRRSDLDDFLAELRIAPEAKKRRK